MNHTAMTGYSTSVRTEQGRLLIRVPNETLVYLGAADETDYLATFARHIQDLRVVALRLAERDHVNVVDVMPNDLKTGSH